MPNQATWTLPSPSPRSCLRRRERAGSKSASLRTLGHGQRTVALISSTTRLPQREEAWRGESQWPQLDGSSGALEGRGCSELTEGDL